MSTTLASRPGIGSAPCATSIVVESMAASASARRSETRFHARLAPNGANRSRLRRRSATSSFPCQNKSIGRGAAPGTGIHVTTRIVASAPANAIREDLDSIPR
jgi:hypothetical protein